jgi:hypothetical protein
MFETESTPSNAPRAAELSVEERRSLTHGDFWIPEEEREKYKRALSALNEGAVPYVVTGAYAIYEYTGIYRETKDLDVFVEPQHVVRALTILRNAGFRTRLEQPHWVAKAMLGDHFVDIIFGMGNGLALVDADWYRHSQPAILAANPVRVAAPEELIWHRLFISERHRQDVADNLHLILCVGHHMDWSRIVEKTGPHWQLLLSQLQMFSYVYPEAKGRVPAWVMEQLLDRARADAGRGRSDEPITRGTLVSRFSFAIDVNEWGLRDLREEAIHSMERLSVIQELARSDVWDEKSEAAERYLQRISR